MLTLGIEIQANLPRLDAAARSAEMQAQQFERLVVLGGEGIGVIAVSVAQSLGYQVRGFLNDFAPVGSMIGRHVPLPVLGESTSWKVHEDDSTGFIVAFGAMQRSEAVLANINEIDIPSSKFITLVSPDANVDRKFVTIGHGSLLAAGSHVSVDAVIDDHCALMGSAYLGHDSSLGSFSRLAAGSVVGAFCEVGRGVHIGTNATIRERVRIGDFSLVGSGAVVLTDVPPRSVVVGNPGRVIRTLEEHQK